MKYKPYSQILDAAAGDAIPQDLDLAPIIMDRIQKGKGVRMQRRTKLVSAVALVVIAFAVLFYTVPGMAAAIGRWFGYVPGVGLVREGQVRVLESPVSETREGVTLTVEQVVLDPERTVLAYSVEGISNEAFSTQPAEHCPYRAQLVLPDGSVLDPGPGGGPGWATGYQHRIEYAPVPAQVNDVRLVISCLYLTRPGSAPESWDIPLRFVPAPADMVAFPVIDIPTPTVQAAAHAPAASAAANAIPASTALSLTLDRAVQMEDGYLIYATVHWKDTPFKSVDVTDMDKRLHLLDANGQEMLYEVRPDDQTGMHFDERETVFAIKTAPVTASGPLTLVLDAVSADVPVEAGFRFDPGPDPQLGQEWTLDEEVRIGEHSLRVLSAAAIENGYNFEMSSITGITRATLADRENTVAGGGGAGGGSLSESNSFSYGIHYADGRPAEPLTVSITSVGLRYAQHLEAQWTPPVASPRLLPTQPAACLTEAIWNNAVSQKPALPDGLSGKVLTYGPVEMDKYDGSWGIILSALDGSDRQIIPDATDGALSPDGTKLAFSRLEAGMAIIDLASGQTTDLAGTAGGDFNPFWSPDGTRLVFNRGMGIFDLFMVDADGQNMRRLTEGGAQEWPVAWLEGGQSLLYTLPGRENEYTNYRLDLASGERAVFSNEDLQLVSAGGKYQVTSEKVFGDRWMISISEADGSNRWVLADGSLWVLAPIWSPDEEWLLAGVSSGDSGSTVGGLINPSTCQVVPLPYIQGSMISWAP